VYEGYSKVVARQALGVVRAWFPHVDLGSLRKRLPKGFSADHYEATVANVGDIASAMVDDMNLEAPYH
jgi:hypothetical protein